MEIREGTGKHRVLIALKSGGKWTTHKLADHIGQAHNSTIRCIHELRRAGYDIRGEIVEGKNYWRYWFVADQPKTVDEHKERLIAAHIEVLPAYPESHPEKKKIQDALTRLRGK